MSRVGMLRVGFLALICIASNSGLAKADPLFATPGQAFYVYRQNPGPPLPQAPQQQTIPPQYYSPTPYQQQPAPSYAYQRPMTYNPPQQQQAYPSYPTQRIAAVPLPQLPPSGQEIPENIRRMRVVQAAESQVGVDKTMNRDYVNQAYSRGQDEAWCADFVSTIFEWSGGSPWGHQGMVKSIYDWAVANQRLTPQPQPGDLVVFGDAQAGPSSIYHIAILEGFNPDASISTIGGNEGQHSGGAVEPDFAGRVQRTSYPAGDRRIVAFIRSI